MVYIVTCTVYITLYYIILYYIILYYFTLSWYIATCTVYISPSQPLQIVGFTYRCVIPSTGSELIATVNTNSSVTCELPGNGVAITEAESVAKVELQWRNNTSTFAIEASSMSQLSECCSQYSHTVRVLCTL